MRAGRDRERMWKGAMWIGELAHAAREKAIEGECCKIA